MYLQNNLYNIDINRAILLSIIFHAGLLIALRWDVTKVLSEPIIEISIQQEEIKKELPRPEPHQ